MPFFASTASKDEALRQAAYLGEVLEVKILASKGGKAVNARNEYNETALHLAAANGHNEVVEVLLFWGADPNIRSKQGVAPLHLAVLGKHEECLVKQLLGKGADPNAMIPGVNVTPLHLAAKLGRPDLVMLLVFWRADPNAQADTGKTALHFCAEDGHAAAAEVLLNIPGFHGVNVKSSSGFTPLHLAAQRGHTSVVELLLARGADISITSPTGSKAVNMAYSGGHQAAFELLEAFMPGDQGSGPAAVKLPPMQACDEVRYRSLFECLRVDSKDACVQGGDVRANCSHMGSKETLCKIWNLVAKSEANLTEEQLVQFMYLADAVKKGSSLPAELPPCFPPKQVMVPQPARAAELPALLASATAVRAELTDQETGFHVAVVHGKIDDVRMLLRDGVDVNVRTVRQETPLHIASMHGYCNVVEVLLFCKAEMDAKDYEGRTALVLASQFGREDIFSELLKKGAGVNFYSKEGDTALHLEASHGNQSRVERLLTKGADTEVKNRKGRTALHQAFANGHADIARTLIAYKASIDAVDSEGNTMLHLAAGHGDKAVVDLMLNQSGVDIRKMLDAKNNAGYRAASLASPKIQKLLSKTTQGIVEKDLKASLAANPGMLFESTQTRPHAAIPASTRVASPQHDSPAVVQTSPYVVASRDNDVARLRLDRSTGSPYAAGMTSREEGKSSAWQISARAAPDTAGKYQSADVSFGSRMKIASTFAGGISAGQISIIQDVFQHFSGVAQALSQAAGPLVPGLFLVAEVFKYLDTVVQQNTEADVLCKRMYKLSQSILEWLDGVLPKVAVDVTLCAKVTKLLEPLWALLNEVAQLLQNPPGGFGLLLGAAKRKRHAAALQMQLQDFVEQMNVATFGLNLELRQQVHDCQQSLDVGLNSIHDTIVSKSAASDAKMQARFDRLEDLVLAQSMASQASFTESLKAKANKVLNDQDLSVADRKTMLATVEIEMQQEVNAMPSAKHA